MVVRPEDLGPMVAVRSGAFILSGENLWSDEAYFFVSIPEWSVDVSGFTPLERQVVIDHRWWPLAELMTTEQLIYPPARELAAFVARLCASGPSGEVVELPWE